MKKKSTIFGIRGRRLGRLVGISYTCTGKCISIERWKTLKVVFFVSLTSM
jgi:hypothetical protein